VFLYREPVEVLASHARERGSQMVPGVLDPEAYRLAGPPATSTSLDEYAARVLAAICESAVHHHELGDMRFVNYNELPDIVWTELCPFFDVPVTEVALERMRQVTRSHGKRPYEPFEPDTAGKQRAASTTMRDVADTWVGPWYQRLEELRLGARSAR
jgi:hypothetical protein